MQPHRRSVAHRSNCRFPLQLHRGSSATRFAKWSYTIAKAAARNEAADCALSSFEPLSVFRGFIQCPLMP